MPVVCQLEKFNSDRIVLARGDGLDLRHGAVLVVPALDGEDVCRHDFLIAYPTAPVLTPLDLITKIAALMPPPRAHRHRYHDVLAPNARLRAAVTAQAPAAVAPALCVPGMPLRGPEISTATREEPHHSAVARYLWASSKIAQDETLPPSLRNAAGAHL